MAKVRKKNSYVIWISLVVGITFLGVFAVLLYKGKHRIHTWMTLKGKEPLEKGKIYARLNRYSEAISEFKKEVRRDPTSFEAHYQLGLSYSRLGEFEQALAEYELACSLQPQSSETELEIASAYLNEAVQCRSGGKDDATVSKLLQQAMASCDQLLSKWPRDSKARVIKGKIYIELNDRERAFTCFKEALAADNNYVPAHLGLVNLYTLEGDYEKAESHCLEALQQNPEDFSMGLTLAIIYSQQGRYEETLKTLDKLATNKQNLFQASIMRGLVCLRMGRYKEALDAAETASKLVPNDMPVVEYIRGVIAIQEKDYTKAITHLRLASVRMPRSAEAHYFLALALIGTNKKEEAKTELQSAITSVPEYLPAKLALAQILAQEARWEEASEYAKEILESEPENVLAIQLLGMAFQAKGQFQEARQKFTSLMKQDSLSANVNLAYLDFAEGKIGRCLRTCDAVLAEDPNQTRVLYLKGLALASNGDLSKARQCLKEVLELAPGFLPATHQLAKMSMASDNREEAIKILTNNLKQNEKDIPSHLLLARIHEEMGETGKAKEEAEQAIDIEKGCLPAYAALGRIYISQQKYEKAADTYQKAIKIQPPLALFYIGLGTAYQLMEDLEGAERAFLEAIRLTPNSPSCYVMLGNVYLHAGRTEKAIGIIENSPLTQGQKKLYQGFISDIKTTNASSRLFEGLNETIFFELNSSYTNALEKCKEVARSAPGNALISAYLGNLLVVKGKPEEALKVYEGLTLSGEFNLPTIYQEMGQVYLRMNDYDKAIWALEEAASSDQASPASRLLLSNLYLQKGDTEKAQAMAEDVLVQDPKNVLALNLLGQSYLLQGKLEEADAEFSKAAGEDNLQDTSYYNLARTRLAKNDIEGCIEGCRKGLEKDSTNPNLRYLLGTVFMRKGEVAKALEEFLEAIDVHPGFVPAYLSIASIHNMQGRPDLALAVCNVALESDPESLEARLILAGCYVGLARYDQAIEQYQRCLAVKGNYSQALFGLAVTYLLKDDTSKSLETLQSLLNERTVLPQTYILLEEIYRRQGNVPQAIQALETLRETNPQSVPVATLARLYLLHGEHDKCINLAGAKSAHLLWVKAVAYQLKGQYEEAETYFQDALLGKQGDNSIAMSLANIALASGQGQKAGTIIEQTTLTPRLKQAYLKLIASTPGDTAPKLAAHLNSMMVYMAEGWAKSATEECKKAKALAPESVAIAYFLGQILIAAGETEQAINSFSDIIQRDSTFSHAYERLAFLHTQKGDEDAALNIYRRLAEVEPNSSAAHLQIAILLEKRGNIDGGIEEYRKVIALTPQSVNGMVAFNNLAWILATKKEKVGESLELARKAKELAPNNAGVIDTLGWIYCLNGQYAEAVKELQQAIRLAYGNSTMHYHLGVAYLKKGMNSRARTQFQKAVRGGDFPEIEEAKRLIQEIDRGNPKVTSLGTF